MGSALRELLVSFGISVDDRELKKGEKEVEGFIGQLKEFGKVAAEAFAIREVKEFIVGQIEAGDKLGDTAEMLGVTSDQLQAFQFAVRSAGGEAESATAALRFLNKHMAEAAGGSAEAQAAFTSLGIPFKNADGTMRPAIDVMGDLADAMKSSEDPAKKVEISMKLLGRAGAEMIPALNKGGDAFRNANKEMAELGGGMSTEFVEQAQQAKEQLVKLDTTFTGLKSTLTLALLPNVMKLVEAFRDLTKGALDVEKKTHIVGDAMKLAPAIIGVIAVWKLVAAFKALKTEELITMALNPFTWMLIAIGLLILAFNELTVTLEGGKSLFTDYFGETGIEDLKDNIDDANDAFGYLGETAEGVIDILDGMWQVLKGVYDILAMIGNLDVYVFKGLLGLSEDGATGTLLEDLKKDMDDLRTPVARSTGYSAQLGRRKARRHAQEAASNETAATANMANPNDTANRFTPFSMLGAYNNPSISPVASEGNGGNVTTINNNSETHVEIHGADVSNPGAVKQAAVSAVSTADERRNSATKTGMKKG